MAKRRTQQRLIICSSEKSVLYKFDKHIGLAIDQKQKHLRQIITMRKTFDNCGVET